MFIIHCWYWFLKFYRGDRSWHHHRNLLYQSNMRDYSSKIHIIFIHSVHFETKILPKLTSKQVNGPPSSPAIASTSSSYAHKWIFFSILPPYFAEQSSKFWILTKPLCNCWAKLKTFPLWPSVSPHPLTSHISPTGNLLSSGFKHAYWTVAPGIAHSPS